jgi:hypothetical protein
MPRARLGVRWLPVPGCDLSRGPLAPAVRAVVPGRRELLPERGVTVDHASIYQWVQQFVGAAEELVLCRGPGRPAKLADPAVPIARPRQRHPRPRGAWRWPDRTVRPYYRSGYRARGLRSRITTSHKILAASFTFSREMALGQRHLLSAQRRFPTHTWVPATGLPWSAVSFPCRAALDDHSWLSRACRRRKRRGPARGWP